MIIVNTLKNKKKEGLNNWSKQLIVFVQYSSRESKSRVRFEGANFRTVFNMLEVQISLKKSILIYFVLNNTLTFSFLFIIGLLLLSSLELKEPHFKIILVPYSVYFNNFLQNACLQRIFFSRYSYRNANEIPYLP